MSGSLASIDSPTESASAVETAGACADRDCPGCGRAAPERFCAHCGEEQAHARDLSLRHFVREGVSAVSDLDSSLLRSLASLLVRPGLLTCEYVHGSRRRYLPPLKLFVVCNVVFFFLESVTHSSVLTTPLYVYLHFQPFRDVVSGLVAERVARRHTTVTAYAAVFNPMVRTQAKTLVITMAPMLALFVGALYARSRRYFVEHLLFSVHFYAFFLLLLAAVGSVLAAAYWTMRALGITPLLLRDDGLGMVLIGACLVYLYGAARRVYGEGRLHTALKCLVLAGGVFGVLQAYRFLLFYTTFVAT
jgi:hypothetical protein